jgi:hypothetical protein
MLFFLSFLLSVWSLFSYVENVRVAHFFSFLWCIVLFFYCNVFLHPVSCVPNAASGSGLSSSCVLCAQCCRWLWIVFILCLVCPMLPVALDCPFFIASSVFFNVYLLTRVLHLGQTYTCTAL